MRAFLIAFGIRFADIWRGQQKAIEKIARLGGAPLPGLLAASPKKNGPFVHINGESVVSFRFNRHEVRYCPGCIQDDLERFDGPKAARPYSRLEWLVGNFRQCDIHGTPLKSVRGGSQFTATGFHQTLAANGVFDEVSAADKGAAKPSAYQTWMRQRLRGDSDPTHWLKDVPFYAATEFCELMGLSLLYPPRHPVSTVDEATWTRGADIGYTAAAAGSDGVGDLLREIMEKESAGTGVFTPRATFGLVFDMLELRKADPAYDQFRSVLADFAEQHLPLPPGTEVFGRKIGRRRVHSVYTAAREAGVHPQSFRRWARRRGLDVPDESEDRTDHRVLFDAEVADQFIAILKGALTVTEVSKITGLPHLILQEVVHGGYMENLTGVPGTPRLRMRFEPGEVARFVEHLFDRAETNWEDRSDAVAAREARKRLQCSNKWLLDILLGERPIWKGTRGGRRFGDLLVDISELKKILASDRQASEGLTKTQLRSRMPRLGKANLNAMAHLGALELKSIYDPVRRSERSLVCPSSALAFEEKYVTLGQLRNMLNIDYAALKATLHDFGVREAFDVATAGARFYDRRRAYDCFKLT
jgi:hypothetical protein